jgi:peptide/nickel transport system ATP-binding protein
MMPHEAVVALRNVSVWFGDPRPVVDAVSLTVAHGEILGVVGESGSGKTTLALTLMGERTNRSRNAGEAIVAGVDMLALGGADLREVRGRTVAYVPQNPATALNPSHTIGSLLVEMQRVHGVAADRAQALERAAAILTEVGFDDPKSMLARYPHQLSGGQQQRVTLAIACVCDPPVLVLDEPTTGLDVSTQKAVLQLLRRLVQRRRAAMVYITHDLSVLAEIADRVAVLYAGCLMEDGPARDILAHPRHPYTSGLIASRPRFTDEAQRAGLKGLLRREDLPAGCVFAPRCALADAACLATRPPLEQVSDAHAIACHRWRDVRPEPPAAALGEHSTVSDVDAPVLTVAGLRVAYRGGSIIGRRAGLVTVAVRDVSLDLRRGEVLAVVGESGSGKSTLARAIMGLRPADAGVLTLDGEPLAAAVTWRSREQARRLQLVFQNPDASLNPRHRIATILTGALRSFESVARAVATERARMALAAVKLPPAYLDRYPDELSGGERQRVAIARALIVSPEVLICDEVLSALDVSVQAGILDLLRNLCAERGLAILFISHDLAVVRAISHRIAVMFRGEVVAWTTPREMLSPPLHPYLAELVAALPGEGFYLRLSLPPAIPLEAEPQGCAYAVRCPVMISSICETQEPPWQSPPHRMRCHHKPPDLSRLMKLERKADDQFR